MGSVFRVDLFYHPYRIALGLIAAIAMAFVTKSAATAVAVVPVVTLVAVSSLVAFAVSAWLVSCQGSRTRPLVVPPGVSALLWARSFRSIIGDPF